MNLNGQARPPFSSALLLVDHEANSAIDRQALRAVGLNRIYQAFSGVAVAKTLAERVSRVLLDDTEVVICLPKLADMNAGQFADLVRSHPLLASLPLLAVASESGQEKTLRDSGFNAVLLRPFNGTTLLNKLHEAKLSSDQARQTLLAYLTEHPGVQDISGFERKLQNFTPPNRNQMDAALALRHGLEMVRERDWDTALPYLQKAAADPRTRGDAGLLLAAYWRASGDVPKTQQALCDALSGYVDLQRPDKIRSVAIKLRDDYPDLPSPLLAEIVSKTKRGLHQDLLELLPLAVEVSSLEQVRAALAAGARLSTDPQQSLTNLGQFLNDNDQAQLLEHLNLPVENATQGAKKSSRFNFLPAKKARPAKPADLDPPAAATPRSDTSWQKQSPELGAQKPGKRAEAQFGGANPVIAPLDLTDLDASDSFSPSSLGDAWNIVKATMFLNKKTKAKNHDLPEQ